VNYVEVFVHFKNRYTLVMTPPPTRKQEASTTTTSNTTTSSQVQQLTKSQSQDDIQSFDNDQGSFSSYSSSSSNNNRPASAADAAPERATLRRGKNTPGGAAPGMSKTQFSAELESLKKGYEEEKSARMELQQLAESMAATIENMRQQIYELQEGNQQLQQRLTDLGY
jgi:hypothetical protein